MGTSRKERPFRLWIVSEELEPPRRLHARVNARRRSRAVILHAKRKPAGMELPVLAHIPFAEGLFVRHPSQKPFTTLLILRQIRSEPRRLLVTTKLLALADFTQKRSLKVIKTDGHNGQF